MTNFEYYKDEIEALGYDFSFTDNEIMECDADFCLGCKFAETSPCAPDKIKWLYSEHEEQPKLTKNERKLCEIMCPINPNNECNECMWGVYPSDWGSEYECSITLIRKMLEKMNNTKTII